MIKIKLFQFMTAFKNFKKDKDIKSFIIIYIFFNFSFFFYFYINPFIFHEAWTFLRNTHQYNFFNFWSSSQNIFLNINLWEENKFFIAMGRYLIFPEYNLMDSLVNKISDVRYLRFIQSFSVSLFIFFLFKTVQNSTNEYLFSIIFSCLFSLSIPILAKIINETTSIHFFWITLVLILADSQKKNLIENKFKYIFSLLILLIISFNYPDLIYFYFIPHLTYFLSKKEIDKITINNLIISSFSIIIVFFLNFLLVNIVRQTSFLPFNNVGNNSYDVSLQLKNSLYKILNFDLMFFINKIYSYFFTSVQNWFYFKNLSYLYFFFIIVILHFFLSKYRRYKFKYIFTLFLSILLLYSPLILVAPEWSIIRNNVILFYLFSYVIMYQIYFNYFNNKKIFYFFVLLCIYSSQTLIYFQYYKINTTIYSNISNQLKSINKKYEKIGFVPMISFDLNDSFNKIPKSKFDFLNLNSEFYGDPHFDILNYSGARADGNVPYILKGLCDDKCRLFLDENSLSFSNIYSNRYRNLKILDNDKNIILIDLNFVYVK